MLWTRLPKMRTAHTISAAALPLESLRRVPRRAFAFLRDDIRQSMTSANLITSANLMTSANSEISDQVPYSLRIGRVVEHHAQLDAAVTVLREVGFGWICRIER